MEVKHEKKQIYLHHTAGGPDAVSVAKYFDTKPERVATAFIIGANGTIVQCFSSRDWAYHLGLKESIFKASKVPYLSLDPISIGIEVCNWGPLSFKNGKYYNYVGGEVNPSNVTTLEVPYKKHKHWFTYTDAQIESLRQLVVYLCETYDIPKDYNESIWDIDLDALKGNKGIFTHNSVRKDKSDMYPCPRVIQMLKNL
jgi:N-acetyl-anhydromuramyl-L-alanine amidase AmpD